MGEIVRFLARIDIPWPILQGDCLAFGEFSSLRTHCRGGPGYMRLLYGDMERVKQQICNGIS